MPDVVVFRPFRAGIFCHLPSHRATPDADVWVPSRAGWYSLFLYSIVVGYYAGDGMIICPTLGSPVADVWIPFRAGWCGRLFLYSIVVKYYAGAGMIL